MLPTNRPELEPQIADSLRAYEKLRPSFSDTEELTFRRNLIELLTAVSPSIETFFRYCPHIPTSRQRQFIDLDDKESFFGGAAGGGKALSVDTAIPTPGGWATMGQLQAGDMVFDDRGHPTRVVACSQVMIDRPCVEVETADGERIIADFDHRWLTTTVVERSAIARQTEDFRARRRLNRPSRSNGTRPHVIENNKRNAASNRGKLDSGSASIKTTAAIADSIKCRGRTNHAIRIQGALVLKPADLPIDPYVLGLWLGDGTSASGDITIAEEQALQVLRDAGVTAIRRGYSCAVKIEGLRALLKTAGLLRNKHIPKIYLRGSVDQRLALLQGLCDSDGHAKPNGAIEFTTTSTRLRDGMVEILSTLGIKARAREGRATLNGKDCGPKWRIVFLTSQPSFRIPRKLDAQKRSGFRGTHEQRWIVAAHPVASRPVRCIKVEAESGMFLCGRSMLPTHNSDALLMAALRYIDVPGYNAIILRRTFQDLSLPEALISRSQEWFANTGVHWTAERKKWTFPSSATISFGHLDHENAKYQFQSAAFQYIGFDEVTQFTESQYKYLFTRLRRLQGMTDVPLRMRCAANPDGIGFEWVKRRFVNPGSPERPFVESKLSDNPHLDRAAYESSLQELDPVTRARYLRGDWEVRPEGKKFKREWFDIVDSYPKFRATCRFWDLAATEAKEGKDPDWTVGTLMGITRDEEVYVIDVKRFRSTAGTVKKIIRQMAVIDGVRTRVCVEMEGGASGKIVDVDMAKLLVGFAYKGIPASGSKEVRAYPFASHAENGFVHVYAGAWNDAWLDELTIFPDGEHDDQIDSASGAFTELAGPRKSTAELLAQAQAAARR